VQQAWLHRGAVAIALAPLAIVFGALTAVRRLLYRRGWRTTTTLRVPVVVVGNLIVGGAGKTPTVIAVVAALRRHGFTPGIVSRGYGGQARQVCEVTCDSRGRDSSVGAPKCAATASAVAALARLTRPGSCRCTSW